MVSDDQTMDITDLEQARRIIAVLRRQMVELVEVTRPALNEFTALLDADHAARLNILFERQKLFEGQDEIWEIEEAFSVFVEEAIDLQWDTAALEHGWPLKPTSTA